MVLLTTTARPIVNTSKDEPFNKKSSFRTQETCNSDIVDEFSLLDESDFVLSSNNARRLVKAIKRSLPSVASRSKSNVPTMSRKDVQVGPVIGVGGFGLVQSVDSINSSSFRRQTRVVCKTPVPHEDPSQLLNACVHLETEKRTLEQLNHPNIIRLRGSSENGPSCIADTKRVDSYFILLDYLPETLTDRIEKWQLQAKDFAKQQRRKLFKGPKMNKELFKEQLQVAIDIAAALQYLHEKRIILRDLKPDNVGFDENGQVKLFDFGLVAQLPSDCDLEATHSLPGQVGTPRYMATEVVQEEPYNHKADVFSFSLVLWQLLTQEKPLSRRGSVYGERPSLPNHWPEALRRILTRGWSDDLAERPCMTEYKLALEDLLRCC